MNRRLCVCLLCEYESVGGQIERMNCPNTEPLGSSQLAQLLHWCLWCPHNPCSWPYKELDTALSLSLCWQLFPVATSRPLHQLKKHFLPSYFVIVGVNINKCSWRYSMKTAPVIRLRHILSTWSTEIKAFIQYFCLFCIKYKYKNISISCCCSSVPVQHPINSSPAAHLWLFTTCCVSCSGLSKLCNPTVYSSFGEITCRSSGGLV